MLLPSRHYHFLDNCWIRRRLALLVCLYHFRFGVPFSLSFWFLFWCGLGSFTHFARFLLPWTFVFFFNCALGGRSFGLRVSDVGLRLPGWLRRWVIGSPAPARRRAGTTAALTSAPCYQHASDSFNAMCWCGLPWVSRNGDGSYWGRGPKMGEILGIYPSFRHKETYFFKEWNIKTGIGEDPKILESVHVWVFDPGVLGWNDQDIL